MRVRHGSSDPKSFAVTVYDGKSHFGRKFEYILRVVLNICQTSLVLREDIIDMLNIFGRAATWI
jgi:hypothetical protein